MNREERRGLLLVALAVGLFSTSPVLILWADPMDPIVKTWGRMVVATLGVGLVILAERIRGVKQQEARVVAGHTRRGAAIRFAAYGLVAALHFFFYVASLSFTTPAHSLSIVYTAPIFVTLFSAAALGEHIKRRQWVGVSVTILGVAILAGLEPRMSSRMAFGDFLALLSAIMFGLYSVAGRYERERYPLLLYAFRVYGIAALWLLPPALLAIPSMPSSAWGLRQVGAVVALGVGPLAIGHTLYNAAVRRVHATYVNIVASQEVTGGIFLSWLILGQVPSVNSLAGAVVTLLGIGIVLR